MQRQCWVNAQYSRRECLEVAGIPRDVSNENLESKVLEVFSKVGCEILSRDIEACHRLANNDRVIVKFLRRKDCDQVMSVKRDLRKVKLEDILLRGSNCIFISLSLCPYYRMLWSKSKRLFDLGSCSILKPTSLFPVEFNRLESLKSLLDKPVCIICSTLYVVIGFLQFVSSHLFKLYLVYVLTFANISMSQILFAKESQVLLAKEFL